ncbi:hypothetical protein PF005_g23696 [Phytophthora fragariae]|uniref:RxLR effector protein n=1 Tax=Phytophthora fragariae TaxID=53985 RepID=A0A6A3RPI6_9STRA|nr:hypothetical protein PF003_g15792 [Phytophthora fragariae]KAE8925350.1 hypothetical protein PF009_g24440 [Phytophthora fragariae]KAE8980493.1 hypothetical protein PF011_g22419 [Phytophthora fragariae]KAE9078772.1 hypothetical protein PF010_g23016 [Phytophthora fragariae]KAE9078863.1 hypothetical protein PF007_g23679 [Phytophthora fragariae]
MFKWTLLLLVALSLLVSIDAITAPAERSAAKLSASSGNYDKRSLRGFMASDETATEERGTAEAAQKLKSMLSTTKLGQKLAASKQVRVAKREAFVKNSTMGRTSKPCPRTRSPRTSCTRGSTLLKPIFRTRTLV